MELTAAIDGMVQEIASRILDMGLERAREILDGRPLAAPPPKLPAPPVARKVPIRVTAERMEARILEVLAESPGVSLRDVHCLADLPVSYSPIRVAAKRLEAQGRIRSEGKAPATRWYVATPAEDTKPAEPPPAAPPAPQEQPTRPPPHPLPRVTPTPMGAGVDLEASAEVQRVLAYLERAPGATPKGVQIAVLEGWSEAAVARLLATLCGRGALTFTNSKGLVRYWRKGARGAA